MRQVNRSRKSSHNTRAKPARRGTRKASRTAPAKKQDTRESFGRRANFRDDVVARTVAGFAASSASAARCFI